MVIEAIEKRVVVQAKDVLLGQVFMTSDWVRYLRVENLKDKNSFTVVDLDNNTVFPFINLDNDCKILDAKLVIEYTPDIEADEN